MPVLIAAQAVAQEGAHLPSPLALASRRTPRRGPPPGHLLERRQPPDREPARHRDPPRRPVQLAPRRFAPGAVVGGEDLEVIAAGRRHRAGWDDGHAGMATELDPLPRAGGGQALLARAGEGAPVGADVQLARAALARQRERLLDHLAAAQEEPAADPAQGPSRSTSASRMKATRLGAANREPSKASSTTNSGTVRSARAAAQRAGLSWTRRSRLKSTTAVFTSHMVTGWPSCPRERRDRRRAP